MNRSIKTWVYQISVVIALMLSQVVSGAEKTLIFCPATGPEGFNPQLYTQTATLDASARTLYNRLVEFKTGTTEIRPALAKSWTISNRGRVYTFYLRENVSFHSNRLFKPGRTFNADDVLFSFERQWQEEHPYYKISDGNYPGFVGMGLKRLLAAIDKIDDLTVRFTLKQPDASFLATLAMDFASILSAEYAYQLLDAETPEQLDLNPVGTGPFRLLDYEPEIQILYQSFDHYWAGRTAIDYLVFSMTADVEQRWQKLSEGNCHILPPLSLEELNRVKKYRDIRILKKSGLDIGFLAFNVKQPPFDNRNVRQALNLAVNKKAIIETVYQAAGRSADTPLPPASWAFSEDLPGYSYDPQKARELLTEAGFSNDFSTQIWYMPVQRFYQPDAQRTAQLIRDDWAQIGVEAELISYPWEEFLQRSRNAEHATILLGWSGDNGDPNNFLSAILGCDAVGGGNRAQWCDPSFEELLRQARFSIDPAIRSEIYKQAQRLFIREAPWIPLAHSFRFQPIRKNVEGFVMDAFSGSYFYGVDLAE